MAEPPADLTELLHHGFRYAMSLTHERAGAEDLVHDACVSILRADGPWHRGYLFATIRNRYIDQYRRKRKVNEVDIDTTEPTGGTFIDDEQADAGLDAMIACETIEAALSLLSPAEREAMYLFAIEGYTAREIGEMTGKPRGTILSLIHRGRKKLLDELSPTGERLDG